MAEAAVGRVADLDVVVVREVEADPAAPREVAGGAVLVDLGADLGLGL